MQWIGVWILRIVLLRLGAQRLMELELYHEAYIVSYVLDIRDYVVLRARIEVFFRPIYWWFNALVLLCKRPPLK